jgi:REP element-mobilizing transposase RayT
MEYPIAYLITFTCYGTRLHGDGKGSVDRHHNRFGTPFLPADVGKCNRAGMLMKQPPYHMDAVRRALVLEAIQEICLQRHWELIAAHVRSTHVHCVVSAAIKSRLLMNAIKAHCSRKLNESGIEPGRSRRWTRGGSKRGLWTEQSIEDAVIYVLDKQGEPMEVFRMSDGGG